MKELVIQIAVKITDKEAKDIENKGINCEALSGRIVVGAKRRVAKVIGAFARPVE